VFRVRLSVLTLILRYQLFKVLIIFLKSFSKAELFLLWVIQVLVVSWMRPFSIDASEGVLGIS